jgi:hypothetical protein
MDLEEEEFVFQIPHFFEDPTSGTAIKLPLLDPFRLSFNMIAFSESFKQILSKVAF